MLRTKLCELFGIEAPIVQGSIGPWTSVELSAAISEAGALGSIGTALKPLEAVRRDIERMRKLTARPFAVNHTLRPLSREAFELSLEARPRVISLAVGADEELVRRTHDAGSLFMQQIHTVEQAERSAEHGVDVIIAQGAEAGGFGGSVAALPLVPQVVDAVSPVPVVAAGGVADGRGLAAALILGADGVNIGTRFLASTEATVSEEWKRRIVESGSHDAVKVQFAGEVFPPPDPGGFETLPRALRTDFIDRGNADPELARREADQMSHALIEAMRAGRAHELVPFTGQTTGLIHDVVPAAEIVQRLVSDAEAALRRASAMASAAGAAGP